MNESTAISIIASIAIASCTALSVTDKILEGKESPVTACVKRAFLQADRIECMKQQTATK